MNFNIIILGFGVIGSESLFEIVKGTKQKNINIAIIDKNINNIPGGVAYSKINSKHGYFNNPLRISNLEFIKWIKRKKKYRKINKIYQFESKL